MGTEETELEMVRRHVREGLAHIAGQHAIIARFRDRGLPTAEAEAVLATFEDLQRQHEDHLAKAEAKDTEG